MKYLLCGVLLLLTATVKAQQVEQFADVQLGPELAIVTMHKGVEADWIIVTVFYHTTLEIGGKAQELLLTKQSVIPAIADTGVAADSVSDPSTVQFVRLEAVKNAAYMEWKKPKP